MGWTCSRRFIRLAELETRMGPAWAAWLLVVLMSAAASGCVTLKTDADEPVVTLEAAGTLYSDPIRVPLISPGGFATFEIEHDDGIQLLVDTSRLGLVDAPDPVRVALVAPDGSVAFHQVGHAELPRATLSPPTHAYVRVDEAQQQWKKGAELKLAPTGGYDFLNTTFERAMLIIGWSDLTTDGEVIVWRTDGTLVTPHAEGPVTSHRFRDFEGGAAAGTDLGQVQRGTSTTAGTQEALTFIMIELQHPTLGTGSLQLEDATLTRSIDVDHSAGSRFVVGTFGGRTTISTAFTAGVDFDIHMMSFSLPKGELESGVWASIT